MCVIEKKEKTKQKQTNKQKKERKKASNNQKQRNNNSNNKTHTHAKSHMYQFQIKLYSNCEVLQTRTVSKIKSATGTCKKHMCVMNISISSTEYCTTLRNNLYKMVQKSQRNPYPLAHSLGQ